MNLHEVEHHIAAAELVEAVDLLAALDAERPSAETKVRLRDLRYQAGESLRTTEGRADWPPQYEDPFGADCGPIPEITRDQLDVATIGGAVANRGLLLVRNLFDDQQAADALHALQQAHEARERDTGGDEWYHRFDVESPDDLPFRERVERNGGTWLADCPATTEHVLSALHDVGVVDAFAAHFGERPVFSLQKSTLRCVAPEQRITAWHQDGSFLDDTVRTMNVWVALSHCGGDLPASGLEIVPKRMTEFMPLKPELAKAAVPFEVVEELAKETPIVRPEFAPGDALIFDERLLHRTYLGPGLTEPRYALECWFFAPSHTTGRYTPFLA